MTGPTLFDHPIDRPHTLTRNDHRDTSHQAAAKILGRTGSKRRQVFELIAEYSHGLTDEQIQTKLRMNPSTQRPRRVELVDAGLIEDSGHRRTTTSGTKAAVWVLTAAGREAVR